MTEYSDVDFNKLLDIIDQAQLLVNDRIDTLRENRVDSNSEEFTFLKDLRSLLKLSENFRD
jgi:hypothetical protein